MTWEYTQMSCEAEQMRDLANEWDGDGWEAVSVVNLPAGHPVPSECGRWQSPTVPAITPVAMLFRRKDES